MSESAQPARPPAAGIDPRGPRFVAGITAFLLVLDVLLGLTGLSASRAAGSDAFAISFASIPQRVLDPAFLLLLVIVLLFAWGVASPRTAPWGALFRAVVRPRLAPPAELEDPRPPRFAQGVGLVVTGVGLILHLLGVPTALPVAAGIAFVAAFLNAAFGYCLGCQMYLLLQRAGVLGRPRAAA